MDHDSPESEETSSTSGPQEIPVKDGPGGRIIGTAFPTEDIGHFEFKITDNEAWENLFVNPNFLDLKYMDLPTISVPLPGFTKLDPPEYDRWSKLAFKIDPIIWAICERLTILGEWFTDWGLKHHNKKETK